MDFSYCVLYKFLGFIFQVVVCITGNSGELVGGSPTIFRSSMSKKDKVIEKLNKIINSLTKQRDYYINELELIKEQRGESEPMIE